MNARADISTYCKGDKVVTKRDAFEEWVQRVRVQVDLRKNSSGYLDMDIDWLWAAFAAGATSQANTEGQR
jgi:hypothetical protein